MAVVGNILSLPLFFGVDLLFGSIFAILAIRYLPLLPAIAVGLIASAYTFHIWGHPWAIIIFTAEIWVTGYLFKRFKLHLIIANLFYWTVIGIPLVWIFYRVVMDIPPTPTLTILFKQPINGFFNVVIASLISLIPIVRQWFELEEDKESFSIKEILLSTLVSAVVIPMVMVFGYFSQQKIQGDIEDKKNQLIQLTEIARNQTLYLFNHYEKTGLTLATKINEESISSKKQLEQEVSNLLNEYQEIQSLEIENFDGSISLSFERPNKKKDFHFLISEQWISQPNQDWKKLRIKFLPTELYENDYGENGYPSISWFTERNELVFTTDPNINHVESNILTEGTLLASEHPGFFQWFPDRGDMPLLLWWRNSFFVNRVPIDQHKPRGELVSSLAVAPVVNRIQTLQYTSLFYLLIIVYLASGLSLLVVRVVGRPMVSIATTTQNIPDKLNELSELHWPDTSVAELQHLCHSSNNTAGTLKFLIDQLESANRELEEKVASRTAQFEQEMHDRLRAREQLSILSVRLKEIHRLSTDRFDSYQENLESYLRTGCSLLGFKFGIISQINLNDYVILACEPVTDSMQPGTHFDLSNTYCAAVYRSGQSIKYDQVGLLPSMSGHPAYKDLKLESYISAPIKIQGKIYGTINFSDLEPKDNITNDEIEFIELMAASLSVVIENELKEQAQIGKELQLIEQSLTDELTKIPNRRALENYLSRTFTEYRLFPKLLTVIMIDVDDFKSLNDKFGHVAGDEVLSRVADTLSLTLRDNDFLARFGGEEFSVVIKNRERIAVAHIAERMRAAVEAMENPYRPVTISLGICCINSSTISQYQSLIEFADKALYSAKEAGKNCFKFHTD